MLLTTANRLMVYGECGVWFTIFNYKDAVEGKIPIFNNQAQNTSPTCLGKASPIQATLSSSSYLTIKGNASKN